MPTSVTSKTATLIDHVLTNSSQKVSQSGVIELDISDHDLVYCTRKTLFLSSINTMTYFLGQLKIAHTQRNFRATKKNWFPKLLDFYLSKQSLSGLYL